VGLGALTDNHHAFTDMSFERMTLEAKCWGATP
jgi:hypothetical protein